MRKLVLLAPVLALAISLAACGGGTAATPPAAAPPATTPPATAPPATTAPATEVKVDAKALFDTKCKACHGVNREGMAGLGPALTPEGLADRSIDEIKETIAHGSKANAMMRAFEGELSAAEIDALANFVKNTAP